MFYLTHIDEDARGALLNQRKKLKPVLDWLEKEQKTLDGTLRLARPDSFQHVQGANLLLSEIVAYIKDPEKAFMALQVQAATDKVTSPGAKTPR